MEYPKGFPPEYQALVEAALAKAEVEFQNAVRELRVPKPGFERTAGSTWEIEAIQAIHSVVLTFASQCIRGVEQKDIPVQEIRRMVEDFLLLATNYVFFTLMAAEGLEEVQRRDWDRFRSFAEECIRDSPEWVEHLKAREKISTGVIKAVTEESAEEDQPKLPDNPADWNTPELRRAGVDQYIADVKLKTNTDINRATIWRAMKYTTSRPFEFWQSCHPKTAKQAEKLIIEFFRTKPHLKSSLLFIISMSS